MKNYSQASENNKKPIFNKLQPFLSSVNSVLEIGSGSGQHSIYFASQIKTLDWQPSEIADNLSALNDNINAAGQKNILPPLQLDVCQNNWPIDKVNCIYTANTLHIIPLDSVKQLFEGVGKILNQTGFLSVYGPFRYKGEFTASSNALFDQWLKQRNPQSGIRDIEALNSLAQAQGLSLLCDYSMPANNQLLIYQRSSQAMR